MRVLAALIWCAGVVFLCGGAWGAQSDAERARNLQREAQSAMNAGDLVGAIAKYNEALAKSAGNADAEIGLAQAYRAVHNYDEARRTLERAVKEHPRNEAALAVLGSLEIELQTYEPAQRHLKAALELKPDDIATRIWLAVAYKSSADSASALGELEKVLARDPKNALAYYERAEIYSNLDRDADALRDAEKALELQPNRLAHVELARILLRMPLQADAAERGGRCSRAAAALEPVVAEQEAAQEKEASAQDSGASGPELTYSESLFLLSRAYQCAGKREQAQKVLAEHETASTNERLTRQKQMEAKHLVQQANEAAMKNDVTGAEELVRQALETNPSYGAAYSQLAKLYYSSGDVEKASEAIAKALALGPYQPDFLYVQGKIFEKQGKPDEALAAFERAALVNPRESDAYFEMGTIYAQRNDVVRARAAFQKAIELSPDDPDYRRALASVK